MNPSLFFLILRARFGLFALALGITLATALAASLLLPKTYRATASLLVEQPDPQSFSDGPSRYSSAAERTGYLQTQVEILHSPIVARRVVQDLRLADRPELRKAFEADAGSGEPIEDWLAELVASSLDVETSQSSVVNISVNAPTADDAAATANGFARAYMDTALQLSVEPNKQAAAWFDEQLKTLRTDLESAQQKLTAYQREHGIVSINENVDDEYSMLANLSGQLVRSVEENVDLTTREQATHRAVDSGASLDSIPVIREDSNVQDLRAELRQGETTLQALAVRFGENHPEYRKQRAQNGYLRSALDAEMRKMAGVASNRRQEGEQRAARIGQAVALQRARVLDLKENRDALAVLMRNVNTAQTAYDTAMQRFVVNQVEGRANHASVTLLNAATPPRAAHSPNILLNLGLALIVGVMLGLALVLIREMTDRRVHSSLELAEVTGAPVLGELVAWTPAARLALPAPQGRLQRNAATGT
jgi:polysaccharide biosynthesis transport protein